MEPVGTSVHRKALGMRGRDLNAAHAVLVSHSASFLVPSMRAPWLKYTAKCAQALACGQVVDSVGHLSVGIETAQVL